MNKDDLLKFNHIIVGALLGLIIPIIIMHFWLGMYLNISLLEVIRNPYFAEIVNILKGSLFVNLGIFFLFYWLKKDKSARGVVLATLLYGAFYMYYMFVM